MRTKDVMRTEVVTVTPETSLKEVAALLVEHGISGMPVCESDGAVVGVVSEADILRLLQRLVAEVPGVVAVRSTLSACATPA